VSNKSGTSGQAITLPQGGGALAGIGESFSPDLFTGTGNFSVPLDLPSGRNGFQPGLSLVYSTGNGNGPFGLGWSLTIPGISRKTSKGIPRYRDTAVDQNERDTFLLSGAEDLVPVSQPEPGVTRFRPRTEGLFAYIERLQTAGEDVWRVRSKDGLVSLYGTPVGETGDPAVVADPTDRAKIFSWRLSRTTDPFGNRIEYTYLRDMGSEGPHTWDQLYLQQVRYIDYKRDGQSRFLVSVTFGYKDRDDEFSEYRAGFAMRTRCRCNRIEVRIHPGDEDLLVRSYELVYLDDRVRAGEVPEERLPLNRVSLLSQVRVVGHDGGRREELPPLEFAYTAFAPERQRFRSLEARGDALPPRSLADEDFEMVDLFANGLPDIVHMNGGVAFWRNLGDGLFDRPQAMDEVPVGVHLRDPGVQLADMNGDGRADLLTLPEGYLPLTFQGRWGARVPYAEAPKVGFEARDIRLVDLDGDGVVDAMRTGERFELFFNDPQEGWQRVETRERRPLAEFPDLSFDDDRVKLADVTGDGLQDFVFVRQGRIDYWPYLGHGRWGRRVTMGNSPTFEDAIGPGGEFDPQHVLFGDLDGDGLDDIAYVGDKRLAFCINQGGGRWSDPVTITGTPPLTDINGSRPIDGVRLADMLGTGMAGVLWTFDRLPGEGSNFRFLDPTGGQKPYLLEEIDNHMGAVTRVEYAPSTKFYLADFEDPQRCWKMPLPFPVQVVERVEIIDEISKGKLTTEYRYHYGYWDGAEREFRGFGRVDQFDTETFERFNAPGLHGEGVAFQGVDVMQFSPPALTKTWFHLGPTGDEFGKRVEADFVSEYWPEDPPVLRRPDTTTDLLDALPHDAHASALRSLRGNVLRTELYALDGSQREDRPFMVTEAQYGLREENPPGEGDGKRLRIFFPHPCGERATQWERGNDPMTRFTFTGNYDAFGQPCTQSQIACPRGWRTLDDSPGTPYLATTTRTVFAAPTEPDAEVHIADRVSKVTTYEIVNDGPPVLDLVDLPETSPGLKVVGQTLNFYDGDAFIGLPTSVVGRHGALMRSESLVLTEELLREAYGDAQPLYLDPSGPPAPGPELPQEFLGLLPSLAGYHFDPGEERQRGYFAATARHRYDFHEAGGTPRGMLTATRDTLGRETVLAYGFFDLLPTEVTDAAGLTTRASYDERVFLPQEVTDPNGNRRRFRYLPLGLLESVVVAGKAEEAAGDTDAAPGVRYEYDLLAFQGDRRPVSARTVRRLHHLLEEDVPAEERNLTVETIEYSDGFGRPLQQRTQAEDVIFGDPVFGGAVLPADQSLPSAGVVGHRRATPESPNVVVSGSRVYDNKGRIVECFEPFFSTGFTYATPVAELGQKVTTFFDPLGRPIRTVNPDGSERRVLFGTTEPTPWETYAFDENDNAGRTHGNGSPVDPQHFDTPASTEVDALGRTVTSIERSGPDPEADRDVTRSTHDIRGNLMTATDALGRVAFRCVYDLANNPIRVDSIDAGARRVVHDAAGNELERRDGKGGLVLRAYDVLQRPTHLWARDDLSGLVTTRDRIFYGDSPEAALGDAEALQANLRGQLYEHYDDAGRTTLARYDFKGNCLEKVRQVLLDELMLAPSRPDWTPPAGMALADHAAQLLDPLEYRVSAAFDALNRTMRIRCPQDTDGARKELRPLYNSSGALERVELEGDAIVDRIAYNAKGQPTLIALGNDVMTRYAYEPTTSRLVRLRSEGYVRPNQLNYQASGAPLQDLAYEHDLVGNITLIRDRAPGSGIPGSALGTDALDRTFAYDPLYRVLSATGRECGPPPNRPPWDDRPRCADVTRARPYVERYRYDAVGNTLKLRHGTNTNGVVRRFTLEAGSNRLATLSRGQSVVPFAYDANGNLVREATSRHFEWDYGDRLKAFRTQAGTAEPSVDVRYAYDAGRRRVKKVVRRQGGVLDSIVYIDGLFEHHRWKRGSVSGENSLVHVLAGGERGAVVRVGSPHPDETGPPVQYHLHDHLGSSGVVVGADGHLVNREEYTPYGETTFGSFARKRYRFMGKERDEESGLSYHGARYYAPWTMRWVSCDPAGIADDLNLYGLSHSNPIAFADRDGLQAEPTVIPKPERPKAAGKSEYWVEDKALHGVFSGSKQEIFEYAAQHNLPVYKYVPEPPLGFDPSDPAAAGGWGNKAVPLPVDEGTVPVDDLEEAATAGTQVGRGERGGRRDGSPHRQGPQ
jgi:RHS repeat-associated protein